MTNKKPIIAIDGPAASGKGTLARAVAETLSYAHLDTGALYRAVGYEVLQIGGDPANEKAATNAAQSLKDKISAASSPDLILHNKTLREDHIGNAASQVAAVTTVREILLDLQRDFAQNPGESYQGAVLDGRDIGTVICPKADVKLFVTADHEIRAERRLKELQSKGIAATKDAVLKDMQERDARDAERQTAPMKPASDAIVLDTSDLNAGQALEKALDIIKDSLAST